jgi:hypothetical protein
MPCFKFADHLMSLNLPCFPLFAYPLFPKNHLYFSIGIAKIAKFLQNKLIGSRKRVSATPIIGMYATRADNMSSSLPTSILTRIANKMIDPTSLYLFRTNFDFQLKLVNRVLKRLAN